MGISTGGGSSKGVQSEINVTPLIDVLLVLLIIFLVVMPLMMKMETLELPPRPDDDRTASESAVTITVTLNPGGSAVVVESSMARGEVVSQISSTDLLSTLRPKLESWTAPGEKVVFVNFHNDIEWSDVIGTVDSIRNLATDVNHDEIKVALKIKEDPAAASNR